MEEGKGTGAKAKHLPFVLHIHFAETCQEEQAFCNSLSE